MEQPSSRQAPPRTGGSARLVLGALPSLVGRRRASLALRSRLGRPRSRPSLNLPVIQSKVPGGYPALFVFCYLISPRNISTFCNLQPIKTFFSNKCLNPQDAPPIASPGQAPGGNLMKLHSFKL